MPPVKVTPERFNLILLNWFCNQNKELVDLGDNIPLKIEGLGSNNQKFYIVHKFTDTVSKYKNALGYCLTGTGLQCRHFYKSNSESFWRIGTGFREDGSWVKGAENYSNEKLTMHGGYIFEGQLHNVFHTKLEELADTIIFPPDYSLFKAIVDLKNTLNSRALFKFFVSHLIELEGTHGFVLYIPEDLGKHRDSGIIDTYAKERIISEAFAPRLTDKVDPDLVDYLPYTQANIQETVRSKQKGVSSATNAKDIAARLKSKDALWNFVNGCLKNIGPPMYEFKHEILNEICRVESFILDEAVIEIAYSKRPLTTKYKSVSGSTSVVTTPACWVKSVYMGKEVSTFGNYLTYPKHLCFLVQKPMDYIDQARIRKEALGPHDRRDQDNYEIIKRMGVKGDLFQTGVGDGKFVVDDDPFHNISGHYINLILYDEKYSPLVRLFKERRKFPLFHWASTKFMESKDIKAALLEFKERDFSTVVLAGITGSCNLYMGGMVKHNPTGINRIDQMKQFIASIKDFSTHEKLEAAYLLVNEALFSLFVKEKPNVLDLDSKTNMSDTFLYLFLSHMAIMIQPFDPFATAYKNSLSVKTKLNLEYSNRAKKTISPNNDVLGRIILKAIMVDSIGKDITDTTRKALLEAIKDYK